MPELPEVQTIVAELCAAGIAGKKITGTIIRWPPLIVGCSVSSFKKLIHGRRIRSISRRGKYIVFALSNRYFLLVHLRMSGQFSIAAPEQKIEAHEHIILRLGNGRELRYRDTRKFGRWQLTADPSAILESLGPEPLAGGFTPGFFFLLLKTRHRQLKPFLLDQRMIAGLGNIYADEALWEARLHPCRISNSLDRRESLGLYKAIRRVLRRAIRNKGTSMGAGMGNYKRLNRRSGKNQDCLNIAREKKSFCPECNALVSRLLVGQRATYICEKCQKLK